MIEYLSLPQRPGPRPQTYKGLPHAQIDVEPVPEINAELFRRVYALPDVENHLTTTSVPGSRGIWLRVDVPLVRPDLTTGPGGREFAHIHPDGSLHVILPGTRARQAVEAGWAEPHPLATAMGKEGRIMLYTPRTFEELSTIVQIVVDAYNAVTGRTVLAETLNRKEQSKGK